MMELFKTMIEIIPFSIILTRKTDNRVIYINKKTIEFFKYDKIEMIGSEAINYYKFPNERNALAQDINNDIPIIDREVTYKRKDGTFFVALITMVTAMYQEEEVILSCISDITQRRQIEEKIKQDNEMIEAMNNELRVKNSILKDRSRRDGLTNLFNHQHINNLLEKEIGKAPKDNQSICVLMLDIDLFKGVNDNFGHQVGDKVLIGVSNLIMQGVRSRDLVGRYGGEEFIVILPEINFEDAYNLAERIRVSIQEYDFEIEGLKVTISIGLAQHDAGDGRTVVNKADKLLYQAKRNGRNRVEVKIEE